MGETGLGKWRGGGLRGGKEGWEGICRNGSANRWAARSCPGGRRDERPSGFRGALAPRLSEKRRPSQTLEWLHHHQNDDADQQQRRHLVGDAVEARRMRPQIGRQIAAPAAEQML